MTSAVWTKTDLNQPVLCNQSQRWNTAGPRVLEVLTDWTNCGCAILRAEARNAQNMILEGYRFTDQSASGEFAVPQTKSLRFWQGDAFATCCVQHYQDGSLEALRGRDQEVFSPEEECFLSRVHWRGSFPLAVNDLGERMAIIVAFEKSQPRWLSREQMSLSWLAAQLTASINMASSLPSGLDDPFVHVCRFIPALPFLESDEQRLAALLRLMCSGRGLGWQRAWFFKKSGASLECRSCAGGLSLEDWGAGAHFAATNLLNLTDEVAHDIVDNPRQEDLMYQSCVANRVLELNSNIIDWDAQQKLDDALFLVPCEMSLDERNSWEAHVATHVEHVKFEEDERIFWCSFQFGTEEFLSILTFSNRRASNSAPRVVETGVLLAVISQLLSSVSTRTRPNELESDSYSDDVNMLLSWLNVAPLSREEFELAKLRRMQLRFENCQAYQDTLRERMLSARSQRGNQ